MLSIFPFMINLPLSTHLLFINSFAKTVAQTTREGMLESPQTKLPKFKIRQKRNLAAQHLHHIIAAKKLTATIHKENMLKQSYYKEKLKILQEQATAMSRIATALERLSDK